MSVTIGRPRGPRRFSESELERVGVTLTDIYRGILHCAACGWGWFVSTPPQGGRLPQGYWKCPQGCNHPE